MDRLTIDQEGARRGELFAHSLQLGNETVTLGNIATMTVEAERFRPYETPRNRRALGLYLGLSGVALIAALIMLGWWGATGGGLLRAAGLIGWALVLGFFLAALFGTRLALKIRQEQDFFRLRIGAADGRQISLVDDSRAMLEQIRDLIRDKIDKEDAATTAVFDLDSDTMQVRRADPPPGASDGQASSFSPAS